MATPSQLGPSSSCVLVVDDEDSMRLRTVAALRQNGFQVIPSAHPFDVLSRLKRGDPLAAIVTDAVMPGMSGPQLCAAVRELAPGLPLVLMGGTPDMAAEVRRLGGHFVQKPRLQPLVDLLRQLVPEQAIRQAG